MTHEFDKGYWETHWQGTAEAPDRAVPPSPYLATELAGLPPGTALDAGCGTGAEALWLAAHGWRVTGLDISAAALDGARAREARAPGAAHPVLWLEADLGTWAPVKTFDLVTTHYAHAEMPQLALYERLAGWVAPGGTLLIVGHLHASGDLHPGHAADAPAHAGQPTADASNGHAAEDAPPSHTAHPAADSSHADVGHPPAEASVTAASVVGVLDPALWNIATAEGHARTLTDGPGRVMMLRDVVVRATRR
jgi:SAM-dependent methyltransferase